MDVDSLVTGTTRHYERLQDLRGEVKLARIYGGLHFREAMEDGERLGRRTARVVEQRFDH